MRLHIECRNLDHVQTRKTAGNVVFCIVYRDCAVHSQGMIGRSGRPFPGNGFVVRQRGPVMNHPVARQIVGGHRQAELLHIARAGRGIDIGCSGRLAGDRDDAAQIPGRGFAVVASEVRALSQRTTAAAGEIKALINESRNRVDLGNERVQEAREQMEEVVSMVERVKQMLEDINLASIEHTRPTPAAGRADRQTAFQWQSKPE